MRLLLDVHIGLALTRACEDRGYDVLRAGAAYHDWPDERLLALARSDDRVLVTEDGDFTDLVFIHGRPPPPGILYLRAPARELASLNHAVLQVLEFGRFRNHIAVITPTGIRYRTLPGMSIDHG